MPDALAIAEDLAKRHPNMRLEKALGHIKHEMNRSRVLAELRTPASPLRVLEPSAVARVAANLRELADRLEGRVA